MSARKGDHVHMVDSGFRCSHCGEIYQMTMPVLVSVMIAASLAFEKSHRGCAKRDLSHLAPKSPAEWRQGWDTGRSSLEIYDFFVLGKTPSEEAYPRDPDDFGRCYRLLKVAPSWRANIQDMSECPVPWSAYVAAWDELERLYEEGLASGTSPGLYARMKALRGDP